MRSEPGAERGLIARQWVIGLMLFGGYAACYFGRANFSVAMPLLVEELRRQGMAADEAVVRLGGIYSLGVLAYALGKMLLGGLGDVWGGRRSFLQIGRAHVSTPVTLESRMPSSA